MHWLLLHTLRDDWYNFWSSNLSPNPWQAGILIVFFKHQNCHYQGCWRTWPFIHKHPDHGWPVCRKHYRTKPSHV